MIASNRFMQESEGRDPDSLGFKSPIEIMLIQRNTFLLTGLFPTRAETNQKLLVPAIPSKSSLEIAFP